MASGIQGALRGHLLIARQPSLLTLDELKCDRLNDCLFVLHHMTTSEILQI